MNKQFKEVKDLIKSIAKPATVVILGVYFMLTPVMSEAADCPEHSFQNDEVTGEAVTTVTASFDSVDFELADNQEDTQDKWNSMLDDLAEYTDDWDGEGARAIQPATIANCRKLLNETSKYEALLDDIFPTDLGTVCIQWYKPSTDALVNAEIAPDRMAFYADEPGKDLYDFPPKTYGKESVYTLVSVLGGLS